MLQFCADKGAWLVEIFTSEEQSTINDILLYDIDYWIGLTDSSAEGHFVWQHSNKSLSWSNWHQGEPNNAQGGEDCVKVSYWGLNGGSWYDFSCDKRKGGRGVHALCEFVNSTTPGTTSTLTTPGTTSTITIPGTTSTMTTHGTTSIITTPGTTSTMTTHGTTSTMQGF